MLSEILKTCEKMLNEKKSDNEILEYLLQPDTLIVLTERELVDLVSYKEPKMRGSLEIQPHPRLSTLYLQQKEIRIKEYNTLVGEEIQFQEDLYNLLNKIEKK